jgi:hypothetical protein
MQVSTAQQEISFIKKIMEDSRRIIVDDGLDFIFWGIVASAGLIITYFLIVTKKWEYIKWTWIVLITIGWIFSISRGIKRGKKRKAFTFTGKILSVTWVACGITMTIIGLIGIFTGSIKGVYISPSISLVLGIAFAVTGTVYEDKWIGLLSIGWWIGGIFMFVFPGIHNILMMAIMMLIFQIFPGIILYSKYKRELTSQIR